MRLKIALLCALVLPLGTAKADVVTLENAVSGSSKAGSTYLYIRLVTSGTGAFQLGTLTLNGSSANDEMNYSLKNSSGDTINSISGTVTSSNGIFTINNANLFGSGTQWLVIENLVASAYNLGNSATLSGGASNVSNGLLTSNFGVDTAPSDIFQASLTVNVPEPATMILTGSALAAGAIGAYFKRRRKPQTEIAA